MWNPFVYYRDERAKEREAFLTVVRELALERDKQTELLLEQTRLLQRYVAMFEYTPQPSALADPDAEIPSGESPTYAWINASES